MLLLILIDFFFAEIPEMHEQEEIQPKSRGEHSKNVRIESGDPRPFHCNLCPYSAKQMSCLKLHIFKMHIFGDQAGLFVQNP